MDRSLFLVSVSASLFVDAVNHGSLREESVLPCTGSDRRGQIWRRPVNEKGPRGEHLSGLHAGVALSGVPSVRPEGPVNARTGGLPHSGAALTVIVVHVYHVSDYKGKTRFV